MDCTVGDEESLVIGEPDAERGDCRCGSSCHVARRRGCCEVRALQTGV